MSFALGSSYVRSSLEGLRVIRGYQLEFSVGNPAMHSFEMRQRKATTMLAVLEDALGAERLSSARVLNVGCSTGLIDEVLADKVKEVVGIDIDEGAITLAKERCTKPNASFFIGDAMSLDFPDASVDVVICSQVYEHVPDPEKMIREIHRILGKGGVCYFAATNRLCIMEQHYRLPFLSIVPVRWAHLYLRLLKRGVYYHERHLTLSGLRELVSGFQVEDYTVKIIDDPDRFCTGYMFNTTFKHLLARALLYCAYWGFPGYIWVLRK